MKISQFIVSQESDDKKSMLVYSTLTTSMIEIDKHIYNDIFNLNLFDIHTDEVKDLFEMGFIVPKEKDELKYLEQLRIETLNANNSAPSYYIVCPTTGCNARCFYCFEKGAVQKRMSEETAQAVAEYIVNYHDPNHLVIQWFGGEPLLEPKTITYIAQYLHDHNVNFDGKIITNGYLLNDENVDLAVRVWNVRIIQITIDALFDSYNKIKDYVYSNGNPFEVVMSNIKRCLKRDIDVRIRINFNPLNCEEAIHTVDYLKERFGNFSNFYIYLAPIDSTEIPAITNTFEEKKKHPLIELLDAEEEYCTFGNYNNREDMDSEYEKILKKYYLTPIPTSCYGGCQSSLTIDSMGNIFNCHRLLGHSEKASGNVFTGRLHNEIEKYYENPYITFDECNSCNLLPLCHGGCKFRRDTYGDEHACTSIKGAVFDLIKRAAKEIEKL